MSFRLRAGQPTTLSSMTTSCAGLQAVDVDAEDRPRAVGAVLVALRPRLRLAIVGDEEEDAAVERLRAAGGGKGDREAKAGSAVRGTREGRRRSRRQNDCEPDFCAARWIVRGHRR